MDSISGRVGKSTLPLVFSAVLLLVFFLPPEAAGQELAGRVLRADTENPLPGANVTVRAHGSGQVRYGSATGTNGRFHVDEISPGAYRLEVTYLGFAEFVRDVELSTGDSLHLEVRLEPSTLPQDEVIVTAGRARQELDPVTAGNLTTREIRAHSDLKDLPTLLAELPSTTVYSQNGNGIGYSVLRMRGFGQKRLAVSVNGIPQNDPENFNVFWINFFDLTGAVQDVQVQRGAGASYYGSTAVGGAIDIVARPYRPEPFARAKVGVGSYGTHRYTVEGGSGRVGDRWVAYGRFSRVLSDGYRDWSWSRFSRYFVGLSRYGSNSTLTIQGYGGPQHDGLAFFGVPKGANDDPDARRANPSAAEDPVPYFTHRGPVERFNQPHWAVHHTWQVRPDWTLDQRLFWIRGAGYFDLGVNYRSPRFLRLPEEIPGIEPAERDQPLFGVLPEADVRQRANLRQNQVGWIPELTWKRESGRTTIGLEARAHRSHRWGRIQEANDAIPDSLVGGGPDRRIYSFRGEKLIASVFGRHRYRPSDRWLIQGGLKGTYRRYRFYDEQFFGHRFAVPYLFLQPRIGVTFSPGGRASAYASAAIARREPQLDHLYDADAAGAGAEPRFRRRPDDSFDYDEPLIDPESLLDLELGAALRGDRYRVRANTYWMEFWNEIVPSGGVDQFGRPRVGNAERTRHLGLELQVAARVVPGWDLSANATISRNRLVAFTEYLTRENEVRAFDRSGDPIAGFPARMARLRSTYRLRGWSARLDFTFAGRQYVDNSGGRTPAGDPAANRIVDPYTLTDASVTYEPDTDGLVEGLRVELRVHNLFDRRVLRFGQMEAAGSRFFPSAPRHYSASVSYTLR